jgi:hypothetical protein
MPVRQLLSREKYAQCARGAPAHQGPRPDRYRRPLELTRPLKAQTVGSSWNGFLIVILLSAGDSPWRHGLDGGASCAARLGIHRPRRRGYFVEGLSGMQ